jgi:hypothetical protein
MPSICQTRKSLKKGILHLATAVLSLPWISALSAAGQTASAGQFTINEIYNELKRREDIRLSGSIDELRRLDFSAFATLSNNNVWYPTTKYLEESTLGKSPAIVDRRPSPIETIKGTELVESLKKQNKSIYGFDPYSDDRLNVCDIKDRLKNELEAGVKSPKYRKYLDCAQGVGFLVRAEMLQEVTSGDYYIESENYSTAFHVCQPARFMDEPCLNKGIGTVFLVTNRLIATVRHNLLPGKGVDVKLDDVKLDDFRIIFDYAEDNTALPLKSVVIKRDDVYSLSKIFAQPKEEDKSDWVILELDRTTSRKPLTLGTSAPKIDGLVYAAGYPCGLPLKVAPKARVRSELGPNGLFLAAVDTFQGNSGSPIMDEDSNQVEGILVNGYPDFAWVAEGKCNIFLIISNTYKGEDVLSVSKIAPYLPCQPGR